MKNISIAILAIGLLVITSCKKESIMSGGSWTFKSKTYNVTSGIASGVYTPTEVTDTTFMGQISGVDTVITVTYDQVFKTLTVVSKDANSYSHIIFTFRELPAADGQYTLTQYPLPDSTGTQISANMILTTGANYDGQTYVPSASTATADVKVKNGLIYLSLTGLDMVNINDPADHEALSCTVNQTVKRD